MNKKLNDKYVKLLKKIHGDTEVNHIEADDLLCNLLVDLGYQEVVDAYDKIDKWYA